ncbi:MAG: glycosyltransferase, partial [Cytophagales bacterium]
RQDRNSKAIIQEIKKLFLEQFVNITGPLQNPNKITRFCNVGVLSSQTEGCSNTLLEYMMIGLPVIITKNSGSIEVLGEDYPFYFEHQDAEELAKHIFAAFNSHDLLKEIRKRNMDIVRTRYSVDRMIKNYISVIESYAQ